jgi:Coenzyme PQQ synthesis protein D (PqqD)
VNALSHIVCPFKLSIKKLLYLTKSKDFSMLHRPVSRKTNLVVRELENEVLLYDLNHHKAYCLNQTSALVYQFCNGKNTVAEISDLMSKELKTLVSEELVWLGLRELKRQGLLENEGELSLQVAGLSRRELLKKARLSSMVLLPVTISIVAPTVANAATCIPYAANCDPSMAGTCCPGSLCVSPGICGCRCVSPGDCITQTSCPSTVNCNGSGVCAP